MGYDLYITRKSKGKVISVDEWAAYVDNRTELVPQPENGRHFVVCTDLEGSPWLDWFEGEVYSKNPDASLIDKMVSIAAELDASVIGEEGEIYSSGSEEPARPKASFKDRFRSWIGQLAPGEPCNAELPDFNVGDRVVDIFGNVATVVGIDLEANNGGGRITTRSETGEERKYLFFAHGLEPFNEGSDKPVSGE